MNKESIYCYHCIKVFWIRGYKLENAKTMSCLYCGKRIIKDKSNKEYFKKYEKELKYA